MEYEEHYENGEPTGRWVEWHDNSLKAEEHYANGERTGRWVFWYPNGQIRSKKSY